MMTGDADGSALECGDLSPLSTPGRLVGPAEPRSAVRRQPAAHVSQAGLRTGARNLSVVDGDKSPAESGDKSPHSKADAWPTRCGEIHRFLCFNTCTVLIKAKES